MRRSRLRRAGRESVYDLINEGRRELAEEMEWVQRQKDKIARGEKE